MRRGILCLRARRGWGWGGCCRGMGETGTVYYFQQDDARSGLGYWEDGTFHCCVTSPPYWGLRDYGHGEQIGLEKTPEEYVSTGPVRNPALTTPNHDPLP